MDVQSNQQSLGPALVTRVPGPGSVALAAQIAAAECPAFDARRRGRAETSGEDQSPIVYARGLGSNVWDVDGNRYVDLTCGFGALSFGHRPAFVEEAVRAQSDELGLALGDVYASAKKAELLSALRALHPSGSGRVMLGLSGADAVTAALKTAALATGKAGVVAFHGSYHGLSHGPLAACGLFEAWRAPFAGQTGDFVRFAPYPRREEDLAATFAEVDRALTSGPVGAVIVEPVLGRGGVVFPPADFLPQLAERARAAGALLVADEIWTGMGRSGAWLASVRAGVAADLICIGKSLGAGHAISACIGTESAMAAWGGHGGTALHTATHFGAPPACAAAIAVIERLADPATFASIEAAGAAFLEALRSGLGAAARVREVRGRGLMFGIEVEGGAARALAVGRKLLHAGYIVLTGGEHGDVLTLTPSFTVEPSLFGPFVAALDSALRSTS